LLPYEMLPAASDDRTEKLAAAAPRIRPHAKAGHEQLDCPAEKIMRLA
jgi:hypothetical protein